jgi:hypothetical protein
MLACSGIDIPLKFITLIMRLLAIMSAIFQRWIVIILHLKFCFFQPALRRPACGIAFFVWFKGYSCALHIHLIMQITQLQQLCFVYLLFALVLFYRFFNVNRIKAFLPLFHLESNLIIFINFFCKAINVHKDTFLRLMVPDKTISLCCIEH